MALINQNSIIGVTSITSPSASNVLTVHTNDTTERLRVSTSGVSFSGTNASLDTSGNATFNGNVSIGGTLTYEDVTNIDSVGIVTARTNIFLGDSLKHLGDDNTLISFPANDTITAHTNGLERVRITSTGQMGLGTNDPNSYGGSVRLAVANTSGTCGVSIVSSTGGDGNLYYADGTSGDATYRGYIRYNHTLDQFRIGVAGAERLRIDSAGLVGINDTSPDATLSVGGSTAFIDVGAAGGNRGKIGYSSNDLYFGTSSSSGEFIFKNNVTSTDNPASSGTERLRITSAGDVGIGTAVPVTSGGYANLSLGKTNGGQLELKKLSSGRSHYIWGDDNLNIGAAYNGSGDLIVKVNGNNERLRVTSGGDLAVGATGEIYGISRLSLRPDNRQTQFSASAGATWHDVVIKQNDTNSSGGNAVGLAFEISTSNYHNNAGTGIAAIKDSNSNDYGCHLAFITRPHAAVAEERMRIHATGEVTKSAQPRFFATLSSTYSTYDGRNVGGSWIAYNNTIYNEGGHFKTSGSDLGRFVAPVTGLYLFHARGYKGTGNNNWSQSWFDVDGSRQIGTDWVVDSSRHAENAIQVHLSAGQKIGFHPYNNQTSNEIISSGNHTYFKGCLLG